jgi:phosphoserine aminotransferase
MMDKLCANMRQLLEIPDNYHVLFFQGGAHGQFAAVPLNLCKKGDKVDYIKTGAWSIRAIEEAQKYADVNVAYDSTSQDNDRFIRDVSEWNLSPDSKYVHITVNETMSGLEFLNDPDVGDRVLVADATSTLLSRPMDISKYGVIYASSGKNLGPAGICMAIVRDDLLGHANENCPSVINWDKMAKTVPIPNIYNTPPTYLLYMCQLFTNHYLDVYGSLAAIEERAINRSSKVYTEMDKSNGFYTNLVEKPFRSRMNCVFRIGDGDLEMEKEFSAAAEKQGIFQLFGHPLMGGLRITLYNGISDDDVDKVIVFMKQFAEDNKHRLDSGSA